MRLSAQLQPSSWAAPESGVKPGNVSKPAREADYAAQVERANEELRRANRQLEEFAYVASHDLREPLRMVNIYTQLLVQRFGQICESDAHQFAEHIQSSVARMEELIQDLLQYSQVIHEGTEYTLARLHLQRPLQQAMNVLREQMKATGAQLEIGELPNVLGDETQLAVVFQNLLSNSVKYAHPERRVCIRIWAERIQDKWTIYVADNGLGFEPEFSERIFGLFKRLHGRDVPGTGLGLAICRRIVERHGGEIRAQGKPQHGATFSFTLKGADHDGPSAFGFANPVGRRQSG